MRDEARRRHRLAHLLLLPIGLLGLLLAATVTFRGALSVDNRHYVEMATGFRVHGLPYTLNAYSEDFEEARPAFNFPKDGKLWGQYPPVYPLVASLALRVAGLAGITKENFLVLAALGYAVFLLGRRLARDPLVGVVAAYLLLFCSPVWASSTETLAQPLLYVWLVLMAFAALCTLDAEREGKPAARYAVLMGVMAGLALGTHLIAAPIGAVALAAFLAVDSGDARVSPWPTRAGLRRFGLALLGWVVPVVPVALLNRERFGSYNPVSYGKCIWSHCALFESSALNAAELLRFFGFALLYFAVVAAALFVARRSVRAVRAVLVVLAVAVLALLVPSPFQSGVLGMLRTLYGYLFDTSNIDFGKVWSYEGLPDALGHLRGGRVIKSLLQSAPIFFVAALVGFGFSGQRARALMVWAPFFGLCAGLALFARWKPPYQFGDPFMLLRYVVPASPFLAVLSAVALSKLPWRAWQTALTATLAAAGIGWLVLVFDDSGLLTRVFLLRLTLVVGLAAALALWQRARALRLAQALVATAVGLSLAVSLGSDTYVLGAIQKSLDRDLADFARQTPKRFAFAGYGAQTDHVLTLRAERDIAYIDLLETRDWIHFRQLMDLWSADGLPIYAIFPGDIDPPFAWPYAATDVRATELDARLHLWKIEPPEHPLGPEQLAALRGSLHEAWERRGRRAP